MIDEAIAQLRYRISAAWRKPRLDMPLLGALLLLMGVGLGTLYSASDLDRGQVISQALRFVLGLTLMVVISRIPPTTLRNWTPWLYAASVVLLVALLLRKPPAVDTGRAELMAASERIERELRREISESSRGLRTEILQTLGTFQEALVRQLAACGLSRKQQVVAYDAQGGMYAARLWWLLRWLGHESVAVLDGGLQAWQAAGFKLDAAPPEAPPPGDFTPGEPLATTADAAAIERNLSSHERLIVDARAPDRYRGENETIDPIGGHIPGAVNRFFKDNLGPDGRFKPAAALREDFMTVLGKERQPERVIAQCGSGVTACHNLLAMEVAGLHGASLYAGSWSEWCADKRRPVATGAQP